MAPRHEFLPMRTVSFDTSRHGNHRQSFDTSRRASLGNVNAMLGRGHSQHRMASRRARWFRRHDGMAYLPDSFISRVKT